MATHFEISDPESTYTNTKVGDDDIRYEMTNSRSDAEARMQTYSGHAAHNSA